MLQSLVRLSARKAASATMALCKAEINVFPCANVAASIRVDTTRQEKFSTQHAKSFASAMLVGLWFVKSSLVALMRNAG